MSRYLVILLLVISFIVPQDASAVSRERKNVGISTDVLAVALPVAAVSYTLATKDWTGLKQGAFAAATTIGATYLLKYTIHKRRPDGSDNHSFPSFHTSSAFAAAAFVQRRYDWKWGIGAYVVATYIGWGRTFAKKHDWWDVLAGAAIGAGASYIFTRPLQHTPFSELSIAPVADPVSSTIGFSFSATLK